MEPPAPWRKKLLRVFSVLAVVMAVSLPGVAESTSHLRQVKGSADAQLRIVGAKVSTEDQAEKLAAEAYFKRMGGKRAIQTAKVVSIHKWWFPFSSWMLRSKVFRGRAIGCGMYGFTEPGISLR